MKQFITFYLTTMVAAMTLFAVGCKDPDFKCANGVCMCADGNNCDIGCAAPPCTVICQGGGTECQAECANGDCNCGPGAVCDFGCVSGPCHVNCDGNDWCSGVCANGDCNCAKGSTCAFDCLSGPCHVNCEGSNPQCDGVCANGTCVCGPNSNCDFDCLDDDCHINCEAGAACTLHCPNNNAGVQGCSFANCAAGEPFICPGGSYTTCGVPCPEADVDS